MPIIAVRYYQLYQHDRRTFAFSSDIARVQLTATESETQEQLAKLNSELASLRELQWELRPMQAAPVLDSTGLFTLTSTVTGSNASFTVSWPKARGGPKAEPPQSTTLLVKRLDGTRQSTIAGSPDYRLPETLDAYRELSKTWISDWEDREQELQNRIEIFKTVSPDIWSFWDFFYFSAITQFTVGYGDILPNATSVRLVVVLQTFVAALLLVVVLNLTFRN
jgi:Ion channel